MLYIIYSKGPLRYETKIYLNFYILELQGKMKDEAAAQCLLFLEPYLTWAFFEPSVMGGRGAMRAPHHNFVVIVPMIMKFGTGVKLEVFYTMVTKNFVTSLLLRHYDVITCISANA